MGLLLIVDTRMPVDWDAAGREVTGHLQSLLRIDTTNPPGIETIAAEFLAGILRQEGIEADVIESAPGRGNVVARLRADDPTGRPLLLMGHTDVVGVERGQWERDPFGGDLADQFLWGRGALDMKGQVAAELETLLLLKRTGVKLGRDVIYAAFADEETGGKYGAAWMWEHHRDLIDAEYAINEGGGWPAMIGGQRYYLCEVGEKGSSRLRIVARGEPGHASVPLDDTAMARLGRALVRLHEWQPPTVITRTIHQLLETIGASLGPDGPALVSRILSDPSWEQLSALPLDEENRRILFATTRNTAVPTIVHGGHRINVIPSEVVLDVDGRILPGEEPEAWRRQVQEVVGNDVVVELVSRQSGIETDPASPLFDAIGETMAELAPGSAVAPYLTSGGTDARHLPDVKVYGFFPTSPTDRAALYGPLVHGHNERIAVDDLVFGTQVLYDLCVRFCGPKDA